MRWDPRRDEGTWLGAGGRGSNPLEAESLHRHLCLVGDFSKYRAFPRISPRDGRFAIFISSDFCGSVLSSLVVGVLYQHGQVMIETAWLRRRYLKEVLGLHSYSQTLVYRPLWPPLGLSLWIVPFFELCPLLIALTSGFLNYFVWGSI